MAEKTVYRLVVVGMGSVGKSCLTIQFMAGRFVEEYDPTLEDSYRKQMSIDGNEVILDICDTAGQDDFSAIRDQYYQSGDGFLCVYSINLLASFNEVQSFHEEILRVKNADSVPIVLAGNKCDLKNQRKVTTQSGRELAASIGAKFFETSAKDQVNVEKVFLSLVREIIKEREKKRTSKKKIEKKGSFKPKCLIS